MYKNKNNNSLFTALTARFIVWLKVVMIAIVVVAFMASCSKGGPITSLINDNDNKPNPSSSFVNNLALESTAVNSFTVGIDTPDKTKYPDAAYIMLVKDGAGTVIASNLVRDTETGGRTTLEFPADRAVVDGKLHNVELQVRSFLDPSKTYGTSEFPVITGATTTPATGIVATGLANQDKTIEFNFDPGSHQAFYVVIGVDPNNMLGEIPGNISRYFALPTADASWKEGMDSDVVITSNAGASTYNVKIAGIIVGYEYKVVIKPVVPRYVLQAKLINEKGEKVPLGTAIKEAIKEAGNNKAKDDIKVDANGSSHATHVAKTSDGSVGEITLVQGDLNITSTKVYFNFNHAVGATHYRYNISNTAGAGSRISDVTWARSNAYAGYESVALTAETDYSLLVIASNSANGKTSRKVLAFKTLAAGKTLGAFAGMFITNENKVAPAKPGVIRLSFARQANAGITAYNIYYYPHDGIDANFPRFPQQIVTYDEAVAQKVYEYTVPGSPAGNKYDVKVEAVRGNTVLGSKIVNDGSFSSYTVPVVGNVRIDQGLNSEITAKNYGTGNLDLDLYVRGRGIVWDGSFGEGRDNVAAGGALRHYIEYTRPDGSKDTYGGFPTPPNFPPGIGDKMKYIINADNSDSAVELTALKDAIGKPFTVTVVVTNSVSGLSSRSTATLTHSSVPTPPLAADITVTEGDKKLDVSWKNAQSQGNVIVGYMIVATNNIDSGKIVTVVTPATSGSATIDGLVNGENYFVVVVPVTASRESVFSIAPFTGLDLTDSTKDGAKMAKYTATGTPTGGTTTDPTAPGGTKAITVTAANGQSPSTGIIVTWTAPDPGAAGDGTPSTITGYGLVYTTGSTVKQVKLAGDLDPLKHEITGLTPKTAYTIDIYATNVLGLVSTKVSVAHTTTATDGTAPGGTTAITLSASNGHAPSSTIMVTWTAPDPGIKTDGTTPSTIIGYGLVYTTGSTVKQVKLAGDVNPLQYEITGLTPSTTYTIDIYATNVLGLASTKVSVAHTTAANDAILPGQPGTLVFSSVSTTNFTVNWAASATGQDARGVAPTVTYKVEISPSNDGVAMAGTASSTQRVITGLRADKSYTMTVTPSTTVGTGTARSGSTKTYAVSLADREVWTIDPTSGKITAKYSVTLTNGTVVNIASITYTTVREQNNLTEPYREAENDPYGWNSVAEEQSTTNLPRNDLGENAAYKKKVSNNDAVLIIIEFASLVGISDYLIAPNKLNGTDVPDRTKDFSFTFGGLGGEISRTTGILNPSSYWEDIGGAGTTVKNENNVKRVSFIIDQNKNTQTYNQFNYINLRVK